MTTEAKLHTAAELLAPWIQETQTPESDRLDLVIQVEDLLAATEALVRAQWGYLSVITGLDLGVDAGQLEVLYHFCAGAAVLTLRVRVPRENASVPTLYYLVPSVSFYERELMEMFGITVDGTPNTDRLFLPDDWPVGVYPLRKDFNIADAQA